MRHAITGAVAALRRLGGFVSKLFSSRDVILTVVSVLIGLAISHVYYRQSIKELASDAEARKREADLILRGVESIGTIQYQRDATGKVTGVKIELRGSASGTSIATGSLSATGGSQGK